MAVLVIQVVWAILQKMRSGLIGPLRISVG